MFFHSLEPCILNSVDIKHPLYGCDMRKLSDARLAEVASRAILPSYKRLMSHIDCQRDDYRILFGLAGSVLRNMARILIQRIRAMMLVGNGELRLEMLDDLLEHAILASVYLVSIFDELAIINGLINKPNSSSSELIQMAWQNEKFRNTIRQTAPEVTALMGVSTPGSLYFAAIRSLRNTIHRQIPDVGTSGRSGGDPAHIKPSIILEGWSHPKIIDLFAKVGWTTFVGIELVGREYLFVNPCTLINIMINDGVVLINQLIDATPVEKLGAKLYCLDDDEGLCPRQLQEYAVRYLQLSHLLSS